MMKNYSKQRGFALIVILIAVLVVGAVTFGVMNWKGQIQQSKQIENQAVIDLQKINDNLRKNNQEIQNNLEDKSIQPAVSIANLKPNDKLGVFTVQQVIIDSGYSTAYFNGITNLTVKNFSQETGNNGTCFEITSKDSQKVPKILEIKNNRFCFNDKDIDKNKEDLSKIGPTTVATVEVKNLVMNEFSQSDQANGNVLGLVKVLSVSEPSISNWKSYNNNELGIKFKYPSEWGEVKLNVESSKNVRNILQGKRVNISFNINSLPNAGYLFSYVNVAPGITVFSKDYKDTEDLEGGGDDYYGRYTEVSDYLSGNTKTLNKNSMACSSASIVSCKSQNNQNANFTIGFNVSQSTQAPVFNLDVQAVADRNKNANFPVIIIGNGLENYNFYDDGNRHVDYKTLEQFVAGMRKALVSPDSFIGKRSRDFEIFISTVEFLK